MKMCAVFILLTALIMSGCASPAKEVSPAYVSPLQYGGFSCKQLEIELHRLSRLIIEKGSKTERARLKAEYEAVEGAAIEKECNAAGELRKAREERQRLEQERKEKERQLEDDAERAYQGS